MAKFLSLLALSSLLILWQPLGALSGTDTAPDPTPFITDYQWVTQGSSITQITTGLEISHKRWFCEFSMGGFGAYENREDAFFIGLNLGRRFPLNSWLFIGADLGFRHVVPSGSDDPLFDTGKFFTLDGRLKLEFVLGRNMRVFIGAASTNIYQNDSFHHVDTREESVFWGVGLL